jgi:hypothetical protein
MWFRSLFDSLMARSSRTPARRHGLNPRRQRAAGARLQVEALEDRSLPSTFSVVNLLDSGAGSLRAAVVAANANPGADAIDFATTGTIALTSGELDITDSLTINGPGESALTVSGEGVSRVFGIAGAPTVVIAGLTVANGWTYDSPGGGLSVAGGAVTLDHVTVTGNYAGGAPGDWYTSYSGSGGVGEGGGLYVAGGTLTLDQSIVSGNAASGGDGANVDAYDVRPDGGDGLGGGLYVAGGMVYVNQSNVSENHAVGGAGGDNIAGYAGYGGFGGGGGIGVAAGKVEFYQSTLTSNTAYGGRVGYPEYSGLPGWSMGGGLYITSADPPLADLDTFTESNTINNIADIDPNIAGPYSLNGMSTQASSFTVSGFPSSTTAGVAGAFTVTAKNADGTAATNYRGTVHFTSSDPQAVLPANYTFTAADPGVHTFSATLKTPGTQSLTATDTGTGSVTGTQVGITVNPAAASAFIVTGFPSPASAAVARNFTITAMDPYGNIATGYTGMVHFSSSDAQAVLPPDSTLTNGTGQFSATLNTAGTQSLTATDSTNTSLSGTQSGITVYAAVKTFAVAGFPSPITAGVAGSFTVTALDSSGSVMTGYTGMVHFTSSDARAWLPADYTFTAADQGVHTFSATLKTAGTQALTVTDRTNTSGTGTQAGITVTTAAVSYFTVAGFPSATTAGDSHSFTITARDLYGNVVAGYSGTVHFTSSDVQAVLPGNYTFTAADQGAHTFSATLKTAGYQSLTARDTAGAIAGSQYVTVNAAAARRLVLSAPTSVNANTAFSLTVTVVDAYGNVVTGYTGTLSFSSSDAMANLPKKYTFTAADRGVHTFTNLRLKKQGKQTVTVTDTLDSSITGSAIVNVV